MQSLQHVSALIARSDQTCRAPCQSLLHISEIIAYILSPQEIAVSALNMAPMRTSSGISVCASDVSNHALIVQGIIVPALT